MLYEHQQQLINQARAVTLPSATGCSSQENSRTNPTSFDQELRFKQIATHRQRPPRSRQTVRLGNVAPKKSATAAQQAAGCSQAASGSWLPTQNNFRLRGENDNLGDPGRNWEKLGEAARTSSPFGLCACGMSGGRQTTRAVTSVRNTWPHHDRRERQMVVSVVAHHYLANMFCWRAGN